MNFRDLDWKRIGLIAGFIALALFFGWLLYYFVTRTDEPVEAPPITTAPPTRPPAGLPPSALRPTPIEIPEAPPTIPTIPSGPPVSPIATGGLVQAIPITSVGTRNIQPAPDGKTVTYYDRPSGKFFRVPPEGKPEALAEKSFPNVETVAWAPNTEKAILEYPDGANILYNFKTNEQVTLPKHWESFSFSPQSDQIVFKSIGLDPDERWLVVARPDGSNARTIEQMGQNDYLVNVEWSPNNQIIASIPEQIDADRQELFFIGLNGENFKSAILPGKGHRTQWSPTGSQLLFSVYTPESNYNPELWVVDGAGDRIGANRRPLNLQTWANKCTFHQNGRTLFCAVPEELPKGMGLLPSLASRIPDRLYQIDIATGARTLLGEPDHDVNASVLVVSDDATALMFLNTLSGKLEKVQLK